MNHPDSLPNESSPIEGAAPAGQSDENGGISRRGLLSGATAAGLASRLGLAASAPLVLGGTARADDIGPEDQRVRVRNAKQIREAAALWQAQQPKPQHVDNGDDELYTADRRGSFSKGLSSHDALGIINPTTYTAYLNALKSGKHSDFELIPVGNTRLANPEAAYAYSMEGPDSHHIGLPAAPAFASARTAAEMVELYWQAQTRDVPFSQYETDPTIAAACAELSTLSDYAGPTLGGVIPQIVFRHSQFIDVLGPMISQFLWVDLPLGSTIDLPQRLKVPVVGDDYGKTYSKWLSIQNGAGQAQDNIYDPIQRYVYSGRSLARWFHKDYTYQAFLNAALYLLDLGGNTLSAKNPYKLSTKQGGFVTFGAAEILDLLAQASRAALRAAWYEKWLVHRRQRPEKFAGFLHNHMTGAATYDIHPDILNSQALAQNFSAHGAYVLPLSYPEGSPTHPAYPSGHASIAGACTAILKAFFNEDYILPFPVVANDDGTALLPYTGPALTIRGEVDKLGWNCGMGRNWSGIHWRSDLEDGMRLGEDAAIRLLHDQLDLYNETFTGFQFTRFDGTVVTIS